jgi:tetratricopeptide (TPR) repeat protein
MIRFRLYIFLTVLLVAAAEDSRAQRPAVGYVSLTDQIERLERALGTTSGARRNTTLLELAQAHYELGRFYTLVWQTTVRINEVYFSIMEEQNRDAGPAAMLFRGIGYYEIGENDKARDMFSRFLSAGGSTVQRLQSDAFAWMGAAWYMDNNRQQAIQQWSKIPEQYDCSVLMYVYSRTGYNLDTIVDRCIGQYSGDDSNADHRIQANIAAGRYADLPRLLRSAELDPAYRFHEGSDREVTYFNPATIVTLSQAHYALAAHYASDAGDRNAARYYRGAFYFRTGRYEEAVRTLTGVRDLRSAMYLAAAYFKTNELSTADDVFDYIERSGDEPLLRELGVLYAELAIPGRQRRALTLTQRGTAPRRPANRRNIEQDSYERLGLVHLYQGNYEAAIEVFSTAFRSEGRGDLRANSPVYLVAYGSAIVLARNFITISEAIDMFSTVMRAYPAATSLVETTSLIDVATNIGREGRIIYRR